ncbi:orotate phosphoribosyltransferase [Vagococcus intermedius]|uniref:Orotate phosphoribosyltransferase n=1 Tax=Vagococcus intermedius TaxID=2991418 RepID=A0AAF0I8J9_9ENTE|nr:orotate phosphoribosyltransferase [Vagococcus intermedius]WEG72617.1 orotate phosphoribosyltransferase [Vagococcus intermedius]WEG74702.1 orotate phosphoribosyltransferase [Vagococcus intermedius]
MTKLGQDIVEKLLEIEAISLKPTEPFTWASGLKSPIYCDNRLTMSYPEVRKLIATGLADTIKKEYPDVEVIAGTATAGIPHAAWVADILELPMVYIRSQAKKHGKGNQIEGRINPQQKMVIIEDLISTGGSVLEAVDAATKEGASVLGVTAIFSYGLPRGVANFKEAGVHLTTLTNYEEMIEKALEIDYINSCDVELLQSWKKDPIAW